MMKHTYQRALSLLLVLCMVLAALPGGTVLAQGAPANYTKLDSGAFTASTLEAGEAEPEEEQSPYGAEDTVRVFIVLRDRSTIEKGYSTAAIASNTGAMEYAGRLELQQDKVARQISRQVLGGEALDVRWNLTLAANAISANVRYGDIAAIEELPDVKAVYLVPVYELDEAWEEAEPATISSGSMVGSYTAWSDGYTGAGSRIAVVDTGIDADHPSFDSDAFDYGLLVAATKSGKTVADYNLLDEEEIASVLPELNAGEALAGVTAKQLHVNDKIAFGFNYVDENLEITHDKDTQGDHGTHVSGIATANRYVAKSTDQGKVYAYADNGVTGVAPDAQLITMKVFGASGGAYADDYIAAIEDAILLNCDAVNLSLGSSTVGFTASGDEYVDGVMDRLTQTDTVVSMSCGNSGYWAEYSKSPTGLLYAEDSNTGRVGSPGSYPNSLAVASADNTGMTGAYFLVGEDFYVYTDTNAVTFDTLDLSEDGSGTDYPYVFLGDPADPEDTAKYAGSAEDFAELDVTGKIVLISRGGGVNFADKQKNAMNAGAAGAVVYNNESGSISMSLSGKLPCISIRKSQMEDILAASVRDESGAWVGTLRVMSGIRTEMDATGGVITMSSFSSWGVPGNLTLKPEITAPGGSIYSTLDGGQYGLMSGTSMAAPSVTGMAAVVAQYIRENGLAGQEGLTVRALSHSLLMGTAVPSMDPESEVEYSPRSQGSGLANVARAVSSPTYITLNGVEDGKVKAELGDDPDREGVYRFFFQVHNLSDAPASYALEASVLAPGVVEYEEERYASMSDVALDADVAFTGSTAYDLNGDGAVDSGDVMAILRHVSGTQALGGDKLAAADLDGSGNVEAVDAQILRDLLAGQAYGELTLRDLLDQSAVTVPAHSSVQVDVTVTLTEAGRAWLEENFVNGTYVEGYVYLRALADSEGAQGVDQSIPFLGFYGNWTDSSMLDRLKYAEHYYDLENHSPYLSLYYENYYTVRLSGISGVFRFGLNRYAQDNAYLADRTAIASDSGDTVASLTYSLVRNAAAVNFDITDAETGEVYYSQAYGSQYGAFYYTNGGAWMNTSTNKSIGWAAKDDEGNPLPNNTKVLMTLTTAPEYNVAADGTISGLGKGAVWSVPVTIDNEAPTVSQMFFSSDALTGQKRLNLRAQDNQYIAAIQILDESGSKLLGRLSPNQTEANAEVALSVDVSEIREDTVVVVLVDYAGNAVGYSLELGNGGEEDPGEELNGFFAFLPSASAWINFDETTTANPTTVAESEPTFTAAEYVNGYVFATDTDQYFYAMRHGKFQPDIICRLDSVMQDLAYNRADGKLYGLTATTGADGALHYGAIVAIDVLTGEVRLAGHLDNLEDGETPQVLACDNDGNFYTVTASAKDSRLYRFTAGADGTLTEPVLVGSTGQKANYLQSMAFDHDTGKLYWAHFYQASAFSRAEKNLLEVNTQTGETAVVGDLVNETTGLFIVSGHTSGFGNADRPAKVFLTRNAVSLYTGNSLVLEGYVTPWNLKDRGILWSSSDPSVATVTTSGEVTGLRAGTAVITAASKADPTVKATCTVTVLALDTALRGILHDGDGDAYFASIDADTAEFSKLSGVTEDFLSAVMAGDTLYAATQGALYQVDPDNGYSASKLCATSVSFTDMAYSPNLDLTLATYGYYLLEVDPEAEGGYSGGWNLRSMFSAIAGVAYAGHDSTYDYFYLLSSSGSLYLTGIQAENGGYSLTLLGYLSTGEGTSISDQYMNQSLFYDGNTGWIYWSRFDGESSSSLIAIHEDTEEVVHRGTFAADVWPVVGLYSAEPAADLDRTGDFRFDGALRFADSQIAFESMEMSPNGSIAGLDD